MDAVAANSSAASTVFAITELVESIIVQLPPRDIFIARRVNHMFNELAKESLAVREAILFSMTTTTDTNNTKFVKTTLDSFFIGVLNQSLYSKEPAYNRVEASWKHVKLTLPPQVRCSMRLKEKMSQIGHIPSGDDGAVRDITNASGVTLGGFSRRLKRVALGGYNDTADRIIVQEVTIKEAMIAIVIDHEMSEEYIARHFPGCRFVRAP